MIMLAAAILLFVGMPLLAVTVIPPAVGMMFFILTLLILNPVFFTTSGLTAANNVKNRWFFPLKHIRFELYSFQTEFFRMALFQAHWFESGMLIFAVIFALSFAGILEMTEPFYLLLYLIFGYGGMAIKLITENMPKRSKQTK